MPVKINIQKPQLNRVRKPEGGALTHGKDRVQQKGNKKQKKETKKTPFSFLARTQAMKSHVFFCLL